MRTKSPGTTGTSAIPPARLDSPGSSDLTSADASASAPHGIALRGITKSFGSHPVLHGVSFTARPGHVTGLLGPNGAGKSTSLRILLGLTRRDAGAALIDGRPYAQWPHPARVVGASLDPQTIDPITSARGHLRTYAAYCGAPRSRVEELITELDMTSYAQRPVGTYSTGMRQRLSLATALLGDPGTIILDEPTNGLDPQASAWTRRRLRAWADEGRTVLVASHVLHELQTVIDDVVMIDRGQVVLESDLPSALSTHGAADLEALYLGMLETGTAA